MVADHHVHAREGVTPGPMTGATVAGTTLAGATATGATATGATVAGSVLCALGAAGATTVFGLPGTHNMAFWGAAGEGPLPRVVNVRHEQTAVYAADGWARASGRLGAALVTTGPGAANTLAAFGEAAMSGSPVVLVASEVPVRVVEAGMKRTLHQSPDQAGMFRSLGKASFTPRSAEAVTADLAIAIETALAPPQGRFTWTSRPIFSGDPRLAPSRRRNWPLAGLTTRHSKWRPNWSTPPATLPSGPAVG